MEEKLDFISMNLQDLRVMFRRLGGTPGNKTKPELIELIKKTQNGEFTPERDGRGRKSLDTPVGVQDNDSGLALKEDRNVENIFSKNRQAEELQDFSKPYRVSGILELHSDGYGFLRKNYQSNSKTDIYLSKGLIKSEGLRVGDYIEGVAEKDKNSASPSLRTITSINSLKKEDATKRAYFDNLIPCYPTEKLSMEILQNPEDVSMRAMDVLCPIGKGQRGLIVAPPKVGKTTLLKKIAKSIETNNKDCELMILLVDERPEEVTDIKHSVNAEVLYSTFDDSAEHHVRLTDLVLSRAKRLVEYGKDVVILLDSITKLTRAVNTFIPSSGKTLSGGLDVNAISPVKKFFGAARNIEGKGSLTIIATALIDTGYKMDEIIFEEFKGTGNMEVILSNELAEKRIFPAIDLLKSGTRKEELLLNPNEMECAYLIRKMLKNNSDGVETLISMFKKTKSNQEFLQKAPHWIKLTSR